MILVETVNRWGLFELRLEGHASGNPFVDVSLECRFSLGARTLVVPGFYDGDGEYVVRFMPDLTGRWSYRTASNASCLDGAEGDFECAGAGAGNHGPVLVDRTFHFRYADGAPYRPFGTTCYAWTHQSAELQDQTVRTLSAAPFNKLRMCVFPKYYDYNRDEPTLLPFEGSIETAWDFSRFNPAFFRNLEKRVGDLQALGIEADLILFHPYDRWGFSRMGQETDDRYLRYVVARLAAFRNVWWSLANEYDLLKEKTNADWERMGALLVSIDPYGHMRSIHNCMSFYDHSRPWITHASIQRVDVYRTAENVDEWRRRWGKPVVVDECAYEGDVNWGWGNISGEELVRRCWEGAVRGGYVGHGETFLADDEVLWWSKGGVLKGESPARIAFLRTVLEDGPAGGLDPAAFGWPHWDLPGAGTVDGSYYLFYFGFNRPRFRPFSLPEGKRYRVDVIDTWNMSVECLAGTYSETFRIELPGRPYMAVRMIAV